MEESIKEWFQMGTAIAIGLAGFGYGIKSVIKFFRKNKTQKNEEKFNYVNMKIWNTITDVKTRGVASRVSVTQFHNGDKFVDGSSMRRMSITSQCCDPKVSSTMQFRQDVLVSRFVEIIEFLQENDSKIRLVSQLHDSNTKKFYEMHDTVAISILPIYCPSSMVAYGYISVEWNDLGNLDKVDDKTFLPYLENARDNIAFLLGSAKDYR